MTEENKLQVLKDRLSAELVGVAMFSENRDEFEQGKAAGLERAIQVIQTMIKEHDW